MDYKDLHLEFFREDNSIYEHKINPNREIDIYRVCAGHKTKIFIVLHPLIIFSVKRADILFKMRTVSPSYPYSVLQKERLSTKDGKRHVSQKTSQTSEFMKPFSRETIKHPTLKNPRSTNSASIVFRFVIINDHNEQPEEQVNYQ